LKRLVVKIGTSTLTAGTDRISRGKIEDIALQISQLKKDYQIILVTSGAIAAARQFSNIKINDDVQIKQALAAIGQLQLMRMYQEIFRDYQLDMAQCLLTYYDFNNQESRNNIKGTIETLLENNFIPVINENDTDTLILATDTDGLYTADPKSNANTQIIAEVSDLSSVSNYISDTKSKQGSGGMRSKIEAAEIAQNGLVETWILNGGNTNFIKRALDENIQFTKIKTP